MFTVSEADPPMGEEGLTPIYSTIAFATLIMVLNNQLSLTHHVVALFFPGQIRTSRHDQNLQKYKFMR